MKLDTLHLHIEPSLNLLSLRQPLQVLAPSLTTLEITWDPDINALLTEVLIKCAKGVRRLVLKLIRVVDRSVVEQLLSRCAYLKYLHISFCYTGELVALLNAVRANLTVLEIGSDALGYWSNTQGWAGTLSEALELPVMSLLKRVRAESHLKRMRDGSRSDELENLVLKCQERGIELCDERRHFTGALIYPLRFTTPVLMLLAQIDPFNPRVR